MHGISKARIAAVVAVAMFGATGAFSGYAAQESTGRVIMAEFNDVSPIISGQQVKVLGVTVGEVGEPSYDAERKVALVPLHVDASALPIHQDATATVAPVSLLGEVFIDLDTGTPGAPVLGGQGLIPVTSTANEPNLQAALETLDDPTAASLAALVVTLGDGLYANGTDVQETISALEPSLRDTDQLVTVLEEQNDLLGGVIDRVEPVTTAIAADEGKTLDRLVASTTALLGTTAAQDAQLRATLAELPSTLAEAEATLAELTGTSGAAATTLGDLRPTTDNLVEISNELQAFADAADPALTALNPVLDRANELLAEARPVAAQLRAAGPNLQRSVDGLEPIVTGLNGNLGDVFGFIRNWALTTNQKDGLSHYFRAGFVLNPDAVSGFIPGGLADQAPDPGPDPTPDEQQDEPGEIGLPVPALPGPEGERNKPGGLLQPGPDPGGSATGLTPEQEQGAVGFLLGGN